MEEINPKDIPMGHVFKRLKNWIAAITGIVGVLGGSFLGYTTIDERYADKTVINTRVDVVQTQVAEMDVEWQIDSNERAIHAVEKGIYDARLEGLKNPQNKVFIDEYLKGLEAKLKSLLDKRGRLDWQYKQQYQQAPQQSQKAPQPYQNRPIERYYR